MTATAGSRSLGQHLATRLSQIGVTEFTAIPGDYNLTLLDELEKEKCLRGVYCCNELGAGYAADGYARAKGVGCCVVTFTVGGLSLINAIAGAYAENLPVICICGGPNTNDFASNHIIHHTLGKPFDFLQEANCFKEVTCEQVVIHNLADAHEQIDRAISAALTQSKPVYINVACNLAGLHHPTFDASPIPYSLTPKQSNQQSLDAAVEAAARFLEGKQKPVAVAGSLLRIAKARPQFMQFVEASGYPFACMAAAKGLVPESSEQFMGTYWGQISDPCVSEVVESADAYLFAGPQFNDYASVGYTTAISEAKMIRLDPYRVTIAGGKGGQVFGCVRMDDFLAALAARVHRNSTSLDIFRRLWTPPPEVPVSPAGSPLQTKVLFKHIQSLLEPSTLLLAETGDSIFNAQKLRLPDGCQYEWSQQYGSIGWSVGATLGLSVAGEQEGRRVLACIGDGSFQMTSQEVSTMLRWQVCPVIFLINNGGYTIEVEIHDGPYNKIANWDYVGLVRAMVHNAATEEGAGSGSGSGLFATRVRTEEELVEALHNVRGEPVDKLCFIECVVHKDDCSKELLEWGARVSAANSRPAAAAP